MLKKLNISKDLQNTTINQFWRLISGPIILLLIPLYLSGEIQGFWFTFISLGALSVFADLGFTNIVLQFSAHEFAYLKFNNNGLLSGENENLKKIGSLFKFAFFWGIKISIIVFPLILMVGFFVLSRKQDENIIWVVPWIIYGLSTVVTFLNNIVLSFVEGCNLVAKIQKIRFFIIFAYSLFIIIFLILKLNLYALSISLLLSSLLGTFLILKSYHSLILQLLSLSSNSNYAWNKKIFPLLKKYSLSWISGYFIFSILTPIAFYFYGPIEAGKIGLSISIWTSITSISYIWISSVYPKINILIEKQDITSLNQVFYKHFIFAIFTFLTLSILFFVVYFFVQNNLQELADRLVGVGSLFILCICWLIQVFIHYLAIYIRSHKVELLVAPSVFSAIYISLSTSIISFFLNEYYFFIGFFTSYLFVFPWIIYIFIKFKRTKYAILQ
ncbi:MAG: hypothetical protein ACK5LP_04645 [Campylobacteraceae bacterium]